MFSVHLSEIPRTISFRTALMFLALFGCSFLALFGYIYWQTTGYLKSEVDAALFHQIDIRSRQAPALRQQEILQHAEQDIGSHTPHALFSADDQPIAGAIQALPDFKRYDKPYEFVWHKKNERSRPIRFMVHKLENGQKLLAAQDIYDISEFDELLINALISGGALLLVVGLLGAITLGYSARPPAGYL
jgi:hypothetical protein